VGRERGGEEGEMWRKVGEGDGEEGEETN